MFEDLHRGAIVYLHIEGKIAQAIVKKIFTASAMTNLGVIFADEQDVTWWVSKKEAEKALGRGNNHDL